MSRTPAYDTTTRCRPSRRRCDFSSCASGTVRKSRRWPLSCGAGERAYRVCPAATTGRRGTRPRCVRRSTTASRPSPRRPNPARWIGRGPVGLGSGRWWMLAQFGGRRDAAAACPGGAGHDVEQRNPGRAAQRRALAQEPARRHPRAIEAIEGTGAPTARRGRPSAASSASSGASASPASGMRATMSPSVIASLRGSAAS